MASIDTDKLNAADDTEPLVLGGSSLTIADTGNTALKGGQGDIGHRLAVPGERRWGLLVPGDFAVIQENGKTFLAMT